MSTTIVHCIRHGKAEVKRIIRYIYTLNKNEFERKTIETLSKMRTLRGDKQQQHEEKEKKNNEKLMLPEHCSSSSAIFHKLTKKKNI